MEKASLENLKFLIFLAFYFFFYEKFVLLPNINFLSTKHNKILKFDPEMLNQSLCHCPKAATVFLRHALT